MSCPLFLLSFLFVMVYFPCCISIHYKIQAWILKVTLNFVQDVYSPGSISGALFSQQLPQSIIEYPIMQWRQLWENMCYPKLIQDFICAL